MFLNFRTLGRWTGIIALALTMWLVWWCQGDRQVRRAQRRLLDAVESKDSTALAELIANDYRDGWDQDKTIVLSRCKQVADMIPNLSIEGEVRSVEEIPGGDYWVRQKITVKGLGPGAVFAREQLDALSQPFSMKWRKRSWKPWDWELIRVENPEFHIPRF